MDSRSSIGVCRYCAVLHMPHSVRSTYYTIEKHTISIGAGRTPIDRRELRDVWTALRSALHIVPALMDEAIGITIITIRSRFGIRAEGYILNCPVNRSGIVITRIQVVIVEHDLSDGW